MVVLVVVLLAALGGVGFAVFERFERGELAARSGEPCNGRDQPAGGAPAALPLGLPLTEGERVLSVATQGVITVAFAGLPGDRDDIVSTRDRVLADLTSAGYRVVGTDQEPGYEAEAQLDGPHEGTLKVSPLCEGLLEVRYRIDG